MIDRYIRHNDARNYLKEGDTERVLDYIRQQKRYDSMINPDVSISNEDKTAILKIAELLMEMEYQVLVYKEHIFYCLRAVWAGEGSENQFSLVNWDEVCLIGDE